MARHILKTDTDVFQASWDEEKNFEIRFDDRNYKVGDDIVLVETLHSGEEMKQGKPLAYTGRAMEFDVYYKLKGQYGLKDGWCILNVGLDWGEEYIPESSEFEQLLEGR